MISPPTPFAYTLTHKSTTSHAHTGILATPHGTVHTPAFIFCATRGAIKAVPTYRLKDLGVQIILANTYHLMLRPGADLIETAGGLHKFMGWDGPLLTDSGGYQIFAMGFGSVSKEIKRTANLPPKSPNPSPKSSSKSSSNSSPKSSPILPPALIKITEQGATFKSYIDGSKVFLSPEQAMHLQAKFSVDLAVQLDECTPYHASPSYTELAMERSLRWAHRSYQAYQKYTTATKQACYGVLQGGVYPHLRKRSAQTLLNMNFFSLAIGGSLGKTQAEMQRIVSLTTKLVYDHKKIKANPIPLHLLGIGDRSSIFYGVRAGIATFDCVAPTRMARHGHAIVPAALTPSGILNLNNARFRHDHTPLDPTTPTPHKTYPYSRAYLHHLIKAKEIAALTILSEHNIAQMTRMMNDIRTAIKTSDNAFNECEHFWCGSTVDNLQ
ncbi:queuine tRNA-ribosyltransferase [Spirochaetota bacterium]|nr:queuine tRNA-ribosyltransferase [Spirochaetota bacterium]